MAALRCAVLMCFVTLLPLSIAHRTTVNEFEDQNQLIASSEQLFSNQTLARRRQQDIPSMQEIWTYISVGILVTVVVLAISQQVKRLPFCRSLPCAAGCAFALSLAGFMLSEMASKQVRNSLEALGATQCETFLEYLTISFGIVLGVNCFALFFGFAGAGCFRECIFRSHASDSMLTKTGQCLLGPLAFGVLQIVLWITLAMQLILSHAYFLTGLVIWGLSLLCFAGQNAIHEAQKLSSDLFSKDVGGRLDFSHYCSATEITGQVGLLLTAGCMLTVLSQAGMLTAMAAEQAKVEDEMVKAAEEDATKTATGKYSRTKASSGAKLPQAPTKEVAKGPATWKVIFEEGCKVRSSKEVSNDNVLYTKKFGEHVEGTQEDDIWIRLTTKEPNYMRIISAKDPTLVMLEKVSMKISGDLRKSVSMLANSPRQSVGGARPSLLQPMGRNVEVPNEHAAAGNPEDQFRWKWTESSSFSGSQWSSWKNAKTTMRDMNTLKVAKPENSSRGVLVQLRVSQEETVGYESIDIAVLILKQMDSPLAELQAEMDANAEANGGKDQLLQLHVTNESNAPSQAGKPAEHQTTVRWKWAESKGYLGSQWSFWRLPEACMDDMRAQRDAKEKNFNRPMVVQISGESEDIHQYDSIDSALNHMDTLVAKADSPDRSAGTSA